MAASDSLFDSISRGRFFGVKLSNEDIAEIKGLRDVAMATNFGCKWTLMGDNDMRLSYKGWFVFSQPLYVCWSLSLSLSLSLSGIVVAAIGIAPGGRLSGWELRH